MYRRNNDLRLEVYWFKSARQGRKCHGGIQSRTQLCLLRDHTPSATVSASAWPDSEAMGSMPQPTQDYPRVVTTASKDDRVRSALVV
jgi:hypothetical protein